MQLEIVPDFELTEVCIGKLKQYESLLYKWQKSLNLVSSSTLNNSWERHFLDSSQLVPFVSRETNICDIGSGAGFPGLVLACAGYKVSLIESDERKCQFLKTVSRETNTPAFIYNDRIENITIEPPDIVVSRALGSLIKLLELTESWWSKNKNIKLIFLKGVQAEAEIMDAKKNSVLIVKFIRA